MARRLRWQAAACRRACPLYAVLLERSAADAEAGGVVWEILQERAYDPGPSALALRFLAPVHRLVLEGRLPELARFYATAGGSEPAAGAWEPFEAALRSHSELVRREAARPCQTNEPGRSAALLGGFLLLARSTGRPLRLLEVGASAGLNLRWDRYRYTGAGAGWGPATSPVRLEGAFVSPPPLTGRLRIAERAGCDLAPLDAASEEGARVLRGFVWPDQPDRLRILEAALAVAAQVPVELERADAGEWLAARLARPRAGVVTAVFHSVFLQYLSAAAHRRLLSELDRAGRLATGEAPLAWLRLEPGPESFEVRLTTWPGGEERLLATSGPHGRNVAWRN